MSNNVEQWGSRWGFIAAAIGMAVGTGNIWRFPRVAAANGGGTFLIAWTVALIVWSLPLLMAEMVIGKTTRMSPIGAFRDLMGRKYTWLGAMFTWICMGIFFYYSVVMGWTLKYFTLGLAGAFKSGADTQAIWNNFLATPSQTILFHFISMVIGGYIVYKGVEEGLEKYLKIMIPSLFVLLVIAAIRAITLPGAAKGVAYLFTPDFSQLGNPKIWLEAFTQSAWSTGAGWGLLLVYATYLKPEDDIGLNCVLTGLGNNSASLIAGLAVIPTIFALSPTLEAANEALASGNTGLTFIYLAKLFPEMPGGRIVAPLFFLAMAVAALSSLLSMIEVAVKVFMDSGKTRKQATIIACVGGFILGIPSAYKAAFLDNQDWVWGVGLLISGLLVSWAMIKNGLEKIRKEHIVPHSDIYIGKWWNVCIGLFPVMFAIIFGWWVWQAITWYPDNWWDPFETFSVGTMVFQWGIFAIIFYLMNNFLADWTLPGPESKKSKATISEGIKEGK